MTLKNENIYQHLDLMDTQGEKEHLLKQHGHIVWFYGLSGSGKSTLALALEKRLKTEGYLTQILDGDSIRSGLNYDLSFSDKDRAENIRRIAEVAKLFLNAGIVTLTAFITPKIEFRDMAKKIIGSDNISEVYVKCPLEICEARDVKGLYAKAESGHIKEFTGKDSVFEEPTNCDLTIDTKECNIDECIEILYPQIIPQIYFQNRLKSK